MGNRPWLPAVTGPPRRLVQALRLAGPATRAQLVELTGLSRATVSGYVAELVERGLVTPADPSGHLPTGGRPASLVQLTRVAGVVVGIDIGRTHVRVAVADLAHEVIGEHVASVPVVDLGADAVLDTVAAQVRAELDRVGATTDDVVGVVAGLPTPVSGAAGALDGTVVKSNILPNWSGTVPAAELRERLGLPVMVDNDANLGALAESRWGAGAGSRSTVYLKLATGIGGALVLDPADDLDVLEEIVRAALGTGARVMSVRSDDLPDGVSAAGLLRFATEG